MQFPSNFQKFLILLLLPFFTISCTQMRNISEKTDTSQTLKQEVMEEKLEDRDINLPPGNSILDDSAGMKIGDLLGFGDDNGKLNLNSITFNVALDQVDFMPLVSVDSVSGVIVTDWYSLDDGNTRMKINIRVVDQQMLDESLVVSLFTQTVKDNRWTDNGINAEQSKKIKESILSSARALKVASEL